MLHERIDARVSIARPWVAPAWADCPCRPAARRAAPRGLTLLEILIVLTLVIATAAIAIPAMTERFENTRFESAIDQIVATLALARAESQRQRQPVQMMWDPANRVVFAAWLDQKALGDAGGSSPGRDGASVSSDRESQESDSPANSNDLGSSAADQLNTAGAEAKAISTGGSRLRVMLPEGCRVKAGANESQRETPAMDGSILPPEQNADSTQSEQAVSLIVYMPDGSTFGEASFVVMDSAGRQSRIDVNPWTGQAAVTRIEASDANATGGDVPPGGSSTNEPSPPSSPFSSPPSRGGDGQ